MSKNLKDLIDDFLIYKCNLGYKYETGERYLRHYQTYMKVNFPVVKIPEKYSIDLYLENYENKPGGLYNAISPLREFSRYLIKIGFANAYVIPDKVTPKQHPKPPYFFSEEEIKSFFKECDIFFHDNNKYPIPQIVIPAMFRIIYCCGLRPKEARFLLMKDMNLNQKYLDVMQSKGPKSRRVYISDELTKYLKVFDCLISQKFINRKYFFPSDLENAYSTNILTYYFHIIWYRAFPKWKGKLPRVYDFRHHFAWYNINEWARNKTDVNAMLPYLMRYMGHNCIKHTLYYFRFVPDFYEDFKRISKELENRIPEVPNE